MDTVRGASDVMMVGALLTRLNPLVKKQLDSLNSLPVTAPSRVVEMDCLTDLFMTCRPGRMVLPYGCTAQEWEGLKSEGWVSLTTQPAEESFSQFYPLGEQSSTKPELGKQDGSQNTLAQAQDRATSLPFGPPAVAWMKPDPGPKYRR